MIKIAFMKTLGYEIRSYLFVQPSEKSSLQYHIKVPRNIKVSLNIKISQQWKDNTQNKA